jgi:hypothetical protein
MNNYINDFRDNDSRKPILRIWREINEREQSVNTSTSTELSEQMEQNSSEDESIN